MATFFSAEMYLNILLPQVIGNLDESKSKENETQLK